MKKMKKIGGFDVEVVPLVHSNKVTWLAYLGERQSASARADTVEEALSLLAEKWAVIKGAYQSAGLPIPVPMGGFDKKSILDQLRTLAELKRRKNL